MRSRECPFSTEADIPITASLVGGLRGPSWNAVPDRNGATRNEGDARYVSVRKQGR